LRIDSPGGVVNGVEETGDLIFNSRGKKPIVAYNDGQMMSAAYWLGSSADEIVSGKTAGAGSIGVLMVHEDWSRWNEKFGINITYLTAGKYKALGNPDQPLTELAKETFQMELDYLYSIFVDTVARNRDVEESDVLANMADGRVFIGQLAVDAGLIDKIGDFKSAVSMAQDMAGAASKKNGRIITMEKTIEELRAEYPDLVKQIEEKAKAGVDLDTPVSEARETERQRILGLADVQFGEEKGGKFRAVVDSGVSVEQFKAIQEINFSHGSQSGDAEPEGEAKGVEKAKGDMLDAIKGAGAENPGFDGNDQGSTGDGGYMEAVERYQAEHKCSKFEAMRQVNLKNPDLRQKYIRKVNAG